MEQTRILLGNVVENYDWVSPGSRGQIAGTASICTKAHLSSTPQRLEASTSPQPLDHIANTEVRNAAVPQ